MKITLMMFLLCSSAFAGGYRDPALDPMGNSSDYGANYGSGSISPSPITDRYFGGYNDPAVVVPIQPGSGPSYISRDQVMTDRQYCFRSAVDGALVCHSH
jgi:hypothetical protein